VTKRKKYVDDLDIQLSDENKSGDEGSVVVDANDYINGIPMDQPQRDIFVVFIAYFSISYSSFIRLGVLVIFKCWNSCMHFLHFTVHVIIHYYNLLRIL